MRMKNLLVAVSAVATLAIPIMAQGPLYDKVIVDLPYSVTIGSKVTGHSKIRLPANSGVGMRDRGDRSI